MNQSERNTRTLQMLEDIVNGETLKTVGEKHNITVERVRQVVKGFCNAYLSDAYRTGDVDKFYPGQDREWYSTMYRASDMCDIDIQSLSDNQMAKLRQHFYFAERCRSRGEIQAIQVLQSSPYPHVDGIDDIREQKEYWLRQIRDQRYKQKLKERKNNAT